MFPVHTLLFAVGADATFTRAALVAPGLGLVAWHTRHCNLVPLATLVSGRGLGFHVGVERSLVLEGFLPLLSPVPRRTG